MAWLDDIQIALRNLDGEAHLSKIYKEVSKHAKRKWAKMYLYLGKYVITYFKYIYPHSRIDILFIIHTLSNITRV